MYTSFYGTPLEPPAPMSQQQLNHQTNKSEDIIRKQQKIIEELMERVRRLEGTVSAMEGELAVAQNVITLLSRQLVETDSYSQRSCMIVTGLRKPKYDKTNKDDALNVISAVAKEAGIDENDFRKHVDKIHPIDGAKNGNQARIIKFTTHSFKEEVFLQHKRNKKIDSGKKKKKNQKDKFHVHLNVEPSLSRNITDLLRKANEAI